MWRKDKDEKFKGETAVVTGASSGIGLEFSHQLAAMGLNVVMISNQHDALTAHAGEIASKFGVNTFPLTIDLTSDDSAESIMGFLKREMIKPVVLINNAGIFDFRSVSILSSSRLDTYIDLHIRAVTRLTIQIGELMAGRANPEGSKYRGYILNMSSMSCWMPMPGIAMYTATKAYIRVFSRALRIELKPRGVSVTVACPGGIATDLFGLPPRLQKLGTSLAILVTPKRFVRNALRHTFSGDAQYINGLINRMAILGCGITPEWMRSLIKSQFLDKVEHSASQALSQSSSVEDQYHQP